jgi:hypothetical protein
VYDLATQTFTAISFPGASNTFPLAINDAGAIAGYYEGLGHPPSGFELKGSSYRQIQPPPPITSYVLGISASGELAGYVLASNGATRSFIFNRGTYRSVLLAKAPSATVYGISPAGTALVGSYLPSSTIVAGFVYQSHALTTLQFPNSNNTSASGLNESGEVTGAFKDASGDWHGFTWTPPAAAEKEIGTKE